MSKKDKKEFERIVRILMQLDEKSLLLIESGAKLLVARQEMDKLKKEELQKTKEEPEKKTRTA